MSGRTTKIGLKAGMLAGAFTPFAYLAVCQTPPPAKVSFGRDVMPVFKAHCITCHSGKSAAGGLDLSTAKGIAKGGTSGLLMIAGNAKASLLVKRLTGSVGPQMPMGMPPLTAADEKSIENWIAQGAAIDGAATPKHWAYVAPVPAPVPDLKSSWVRNPIDGFVLARMKKAGLHPSPEAPKETLVRRLYLDLVGLPPTPAEVDAFLADKMPDAYERLVDKLLASPHYGERQARGWLDLARYADTDGYEKDLNRTAWEYRDWVIAAFNKNLPYDKFTIDQIAGDMLPNATLEDKIATGFHRNTMFNREGGVDQAEAHFAVVTDRVDTTATVWLGSTLGCARCHDHKYDPFTQKDYYKMAAIYSNTVVIPRGPKAIGEEKWFEPEVPVPSAEQETEQKRLTAQVTELQSKLDHPDSDAQKAYQDWANRPLEIVSWSPMKPLIANAASGETFQMSPDGTVLVTGKTPDKDSFHVAFGSGNAAISGLKLEVLDDASLPSKGPGRADNGNFVLTAIKVTAAGKPVALAAGAADYTQQQYDAMTAVLGNKDAGWAVNGQVGKPHQLVVSFVDPVPVGAPISVTLEFQSPYPQHIIGKFRISATNASDPLSALMPDGVKTVRLLANRSPEQEKQLRDYYQSVSPQFAELRRQLAETKMKLEQLNGAIPTAMVMHEQPHKGPLTEWVRSRGQFLTKTEEVQAGTPGFLPPLPPGLANRLTMAEWLVSKSNPLTARVEVNRIWEQYFGRGIVETSEDFGTRCSPPTHPELLDWLACKFMQTGWDMKAIHRLIVTSATYRQSSDASPALMAKDPQNLLYARGPRFRMEAELIHDATLAVSGLLSEKIGGPSVYPYQPDGIWASPYSGEQWMPSKGQDAYRRGLYTFLKRTAPYPSFEALDATSRESCTVRRVRTNTPLQALALLNDKLMIQAAKALGKRMESAGKTPDARLTEGFRLCTSRKPSGPELKRLERLESTLEARYQAKPKEAAVLAGDPQDAAWTMVGNVLLNLDETITKE